MLIGKAIRLFRVARGLSQKELAEKTGLDKSYISLIESGLREPSLKVIGKIDEVFGTSSFMFVALSHKDNLKCVNEKTASVIGKEIIDLLIGE